MTSSSQSESGVLLQQNLPGGGTEIQVFPTRNSFDSIGTSQLCVSIYLIISVLYSTEVILWAPSSEMEAWHVRPSGLGHKTFQT